MSEQENQPPTPPAQPTAKTSTVPLKKETVRITLRAKPGTGTPSAPPPAPSGAPAPPRPPSAAGAPPAPPRPAGAPPAPGAPKPPAGAKTIPLTSAPMPKPPGGAPVAQPTAKLSAPGAPGAPGTRPMPKATVQLQPTQPLAGRPTSPVRTGPLTGPVQTGAIKSAAGSQLMDDSDDEEAGVTPFAIICLVLAVAVLSIQLFSSQKFFPSALPPEKNPNDKLIPSTGDWTPNLNLKDIPEAPAELEAN